MIELGENLSTWSRLDRQRCAAAHPGVTWHSRPTQCTGLMARTALKHVYGSDEQRAERPRCANVAHWRFKALRPRGAWITASDGDYCWSHLVYRGLVGTMDEEARTQRHVRRWIERERRKKEEYGEAE